MKIERMIDTKLSVLIIDDEEGIREALRAYLELMNVFTSIVEAVDGGDAFTKTQNQKFDLVVVDLMMPKINGITFIENLNRSENLKQVKETPSIIVLSGSITGAELDRSVKLGVKNILTKPISSQNFAKKVKEVLVREKSTKVRRIKQD